MIEGIDCASPVNNAAAVKKAGKQFVCRYLSTRGNPKNLTLAEAKRLRAAGLAIVVVFETTAKRALSGYDAGSLDATSVFPQLAMCGLPRMPVYFAVDFDAAAADQAHIDSYLRGAASVLGRDNVGVYGGYYVVKRALDAGVCKYGWQTYAWSGGHWDARAQIQQYKNGVKVAGLQVDLDRATVADYGQWPRPSAKPKPAATANPAAAKLVPLPGPARKPVWFWPAVKEFVRRRNKQGGKP